MGSWLTAEERQPILDVLARLGRDDGDAEADLDAIEYAVAHYWHLMAAIIDDDNRRLETIEGLAAALSQQLAELPPHYLAEFSEGDPEWGLLALDPQVLTALEEQDVLVWPEAYQLPLRRQRRVWFPHQAGSRLQTAQYVVERIETWVGQARNRRTKRLRGRQFEYELRWLVVALKRLWIDRLGRPFQPQARKRGSISDLVSAVVAVADPHLPAPTALSILRPKDKRRSKTTQPRSAK